MTQQLKERWKAFLFDINWVPIYITIGVPYQMLFGSTSVVSGPIDSVKREGVHGFHFYINPDVPCNVTPFSRNSFRIDGSLNFIKSCIKVVLKNKIP